MLILDVGTLNDFIAESVEKFYNIDNDTIGQMLISDIHRIKNYEGQLDPELLLVYYDYQ